MKKKKKKEMKKKKIKKPGIITFQYYSKESSNGVSRDGAPSSPVGRVITADQQTGGFQRKPIKEEEPEDDDEFLYCEDCRSYFINKCEVHGLALFISDTPVPLGIADRARQTLPLGLEVRKSKHS
ncbi:hypothetical protein QTP70_000426 [Hemibagrus guttatus]|uniref:Uncharacterized protein n=1 Tax=Hemibagrus guttatus TaxID=175788 RepID=A0AAE0UWN9_9TELE|nr:hypothetical protein QTP70_000426 [Hemibagrus guttatus]